MAMHIMYIIYHLVPTTAKTIHTEQQYCENTSLDRYIAQFSRVHKRVQTCWDVTPRPKPGYFLVKWLLIQLQTWQDYSNNTLYVKQTAIPLYAIQNIELLPNCKTTIAVIADGANELQYNKLI